MIYCKTLVLNKRDKREILVCVVRHLNLHFKCILKCAIVYDSECKMNFPRPSQGENNVRIALRRFT